MAISKALIKKGITISESDILQWGFEDSQYGENIKSLGEWVYDTLKEKGKYSTTLRRFIDTRYPDIDLWACKIDYKVIDFDEFEKEYDEGDMIPAKDITIIRDLTKGSTLKV